jgi:uncharacterized protein YndB with AHSA1/START domain
MTAATAAPAAETRAVKLDFDLAAPPDKVWRALTEKDILAKWMYPNDMVAKVGHKFQFRSQPYGQWNGIIDCEVIEATPPKRLRFIWVSAGVDTVVSWTLTATADGTRVHLEQSGVPAAPQAYNGAIYAWNRFFKEALPKELAEAK